MRPSAVVAGGAGFIGYHMVRRLLAEGFHVHIVDNFATGSHQNASSLLVEDRCDLLAADICHRIDLPGPIEYVINLASPASPVDFERIPIDIMAANSLGVRNLLDLALHKGAVFLQSSTSEVYGDPEVHPQREDYTGNVNMIGPRSVYDEGKRFAEAMSFAYLRKYRVPTRIARIFNTYGPNMRSDDGRVIPNFCMQALSGQPLTVYGDVCRTRSFCYVDDLVEGLFRLMLSEHTAPVNLGNPLEVSIVQVAQMTIALAGSPSSVTTVPLLHADDPRRRRPDIARAREWLNWEPKTDLETGLRYTLDYFRSYSDPAPQDRQRKGEGSP